jgi:hypothetical protein
MERSGYHHGNLREALIRAALSLTAERGPAGLIFAGAVRPLAGDAGRGRIVPFPTGCRPPISGSGRPAVPSLLRTAAARGIVGHRTCIGSTSGSAPGSSRWSPSG